MILTVNGLYVLIKKQRLLDWILKKIKMQPYAAKSKHTLNIKK